MATPSCSSGVQAAASASGVNPSDPVGLGRPHVGVAEALQLLVPAAVVGQRHAVEGDGDPVAGAGPRARGRAGRRPRSWPPYYTLRAHWTHEPRPRGPDPRAPAPAPARRRRTRHGPVAVLDGVGPRPAEWRLDEHTREVGRRGIAAARAGSADRGRPPTPPRAGRRPPRRAPVAPPDRAPTTVRAWRPWPNGSGLAPDARLLILNCADLGLCHAADHRRLRGAPRPASPPRRR